MLVTNALNQGGRVFTQYRGLSFQSDLPPGAGNANAQDANPPSPWSSFPNGQQVPVPLTVPEPGTWALVAMGTGHGAFLRGRKQVRR